MIQSALYSSSISFTKTTQVSISVDFDCFDGLDNVLLFSNLFPIDIDFADQNFNITEFSFFMESYRFYSNVTSPIYAVTMGLEESEKTTKDTFMEEVESYMISKIVNFISLYWFPVLIPIGVVGNILSFLVMIKPNNRKMSTCIYMAAISINDNIMMYMSSHIYLVSALQIHKWNPIECHWIGLVALFALQNCTFQIVAMTIDKYIAIKWPHKAATYSTPRRAKRITASLYAFTLICNIPNFFLTREIGGQCVAYSVSSVIARVYSWFIFVLNAVIPFTLLIYMNYVIVKAVRQSRKMFRTNEETTDGGKNKGMDRRQKTMKSAENQLTIMLLMVTTLFLILLCPTYFRFIYLAFAKRDTPFEYAKSMLIYQVSSKLYITNSGINFFLYCISGEKFRNDLKEILCCCSISRPSLRSKDDPLATAIETSTIVSNSSNSTLSQQFFKG